MMLTGHEKSLPINFFYPEYEGKKTSPQVCVGDVIRRQQEAGARAYSVGDYVWVFQNVIPPKGTKKLLKNGGDPS